MRRKPNAFVSGFGRDHSNAIARQGGFDRVWDHRRDEPMRLPLAEQREFNFGIFLALFGLACAGCALLGIAAGASLS
ncbi:MAG: hypothetical protein KAG89_20145 [Fulvimarina manganoxydans]|uniref:hypothetical protein n=1 Tax=Fulvimarina manganoxydans TaxID=937218 RepID=UPI0023544566|nr:hypothetical protein [Fulvimarina manganoxydans]MCK5934470.1 hypothetical protein [Fulvimarina manganoxydans]